MNQPPLASLFDNNRDWADGVRQQDPTFFERLAQQQAPEYLWIGCSDSRVPANQIVGLAPGELFVHRNVANVVVHTDLNCLSVMQFAIEALHVRHIMVVGHYGCGGVRAALENSKLGLIDNWLRHVQDAMRKHVAQLGAIEDAKARLDRLCELNVIEQAMNVCQTTLVQDAWAREQPLSVHGLIYSIADGRLRDLSFSVSRQDDLADAYRVAVDASATLR